jgi:hypothetical protein
MSGGASALDLLQDIVSFGRPHEGLGIGVVARDVFFNSFDQLGDAGETTASKLFLSALERIARPC